MDEHITRILKMLEEGKISATDAQSLIAALGTSAPPKSDTDGPKPERDSTKYHFTGSGAGPSSAAGSSRYAAGEDAKPEEREPQSSSSKSFEFPWSRKSSLPFDLSGLGKQISDALKKVDPDRVIREARVGVRRGGRRLQDRMKTWSRILEGEDGRPCNPEGRPSVLETETLNFQAGPETSIRVENSFGSVKVVGGADEISVDLEKEVWDLDQAAAEMRLKYLKVEAYTHQMPGSGASRLDVRVTAPDDWEDGLGNIVLRVPSSVSLKLETVFGDISVEDIAGVVEVHTVSGSVNFARLSGAVRGEGISGAMRAEEIGGHLHLAGKSGDVFASKLSSGGEVLSVSGEVTVEDSEGARLEAKSVSGDVNLSRIGSAAPVEVIVESVSGDVRLEDVKGSVSLQTISGDAEVIGSATGLFTAKTVSGDLDVALSSPFAGVISLGTMSGDVNLTVPPDAGFRYTLDTQSGSIEFDLAGEVGSRSSTLFTGSVGGGEGSVSVQTRSGDVRVTAA